MGVMIGWNKGKGECTLGLLYGRINLKNYTPRHVH